MAGLRFAYDEQAVPATPIASPIQDDTAVGQATTGGLRFAYDAPRKTVAPAAPAAPEQGDFSRGIGIAVDQAKQTIAGGKALLADTVGATKMRDEALADYQAQGEEIGKRQKDTDSFSNVWEKGDFGDAIDFLQYAAGNVTAQAGMAIGSALAGGGLGGIASLFGKGAVKKGVEAYAKKRLKDKIEEDGLEAGTKAAFRELGAGATLSAFNLSQSLGHTYPEAFEEAAARGEDPGLLRVYASGVLSAAIETATDALNLKGIGKAVSGKASADPSMLKRIATEAFMSGMREAGTEVAQSGVERWGATKDLTSPEAIREYVDSAAIGLVGGTMFGGVKGAVTRPKVDAPPATTDAPAATLPEGQPFASGILVTPELREKHAEQLRASGFDPESEESDWAIRNIEGLERATGVIRGKASMEEREKRRAEVEEAFGKSATSGVGVGVGEAGLLTPRAAVTPDPENRTVTVDDPTATVPLPDTSWYQPGQSTAAVSGEDFVARKEGWEAIPSFDVPAGTEISPRIVVPKDDGSASVRNYFTSPKHAEKLVDYLGETYDGVLARVRKGKRAESAGGGSYYFVEIKPTEGFQWPLKPRTKLGPPDRPKLDTNGIDSNTVDVNATEVNQAPPLAPPTRSLPGAPAQKVDTSPAPVQETPKSEQVEPTATAEPPAATAAPAAPKPSRSAGKATGVWKGTPLETRVQKVIDDLTDAGLPRDAKAVDIGASVDAKSGNLTEEKVAAREAAAKAKIAKAGKTKEAEDYGARWTRTTTVERQAAVASAFPDRVDSAGNLNESGRRLAAQAWKTIGSAAKTRLQNVLDGKPPVAENKPAGTAPAPQGNPDEAVVRKAQARLRTRSGDGAYLLDNADEPADPLSQAAARVAREVFGRKVFWVKQSGKRLFNGAITPEGDILLDVNSKKSHLAVLGHELLHAMRRDNPALYDRFIRDLLKNSRDLSSFRKELDEAYAKKGLKALVDSKFHEEFGADVVGDFFTDPKFWQGLKKRDATLFQQVADFLIDFLDNLYNTLLQIDKLRPENTDAYLKNVQEVRKLAVAAIGEYAESRRAPPAPPQVQEELFSVDRDLTQQEADDLFAQAITAPSNNPTMNWVIVDQVSARAKLKLPTFRESKAITKREFGEAVDKYRTGKIAMDDFSPAAIRRLARALATEVQWYAGYSPDSGIDWYRGKFQRAVDALAEAEPTLQDPDNRALFIAMLAITSDGAEVQDNMNMAMAMYLGYLSTGSVLTAAPRTGKYKKSIIKNAEVIDNLVSDRGLSGAMKFLLQPRKVSDIKAEMKKLKMENPASNYPDSATLPRAAVFLGPKLGAFYANLRGETGYLTMDRWWNRTINRYRGYMTPSPTEQSIESLRELLGEPDLSDEGVIEAATEIAKERDKRIKEDRGYASSKMETLATTIYKNAKTELNDSPANAADRAFQIAVVKSAQRMLRARGMDVAVADIQATIWYFEKELFDKIGIRGKGRISYEEAAGRWIRGRNGPAAPAAGGADGRAAARPGQRGRRDAAAEAAALQDDLFSVDRDGGGRVPRRGLAPLPGAPAVQGVSGPDPQLVEVAERYALNNGIALGRQAEYVDVDPARAKRIADAYQAMQHAPKDPAVREAYENLIRQTRAQYDALVAAGYKFTFFDSKSDPYAGNPWNAMRDLRANKRMAVYGTYDGYGTEGVTRGDLAENPMLADTGLQWPDRDGVMRPVAANDLFRAVHDAFGHGLEGAGFRARGEENAWQAHVRLFTGSAVGAITTETRGQNSWLNYGPYGESNQNAPVEGTVFADQKTGLMPEWTWTEGRVADEDQLSIERVKANPGVNLKRLAGLLGPQLYGDMKKMPQVAVKEMFQNAFDASKGRLTKGSDEQGQVAVAIDTKNNRITVADNGTGMTTEVLGGPFLQIAGTNKEGERSSGGFGIAKMQFLFGSKELEVYTLRDGVLSVLKSTGEQLMGAMDNPKARPQIEVYRGEEAKEVFRQKAFEAWQAARGDWRDQEQAQALDSGTVVTIATPTEYVDPSTGATEKITMPDSGYEYDVLNKSPLFENIKVNVGIDGNRWYGNKLGTEFPADEYSRAFDVKFAWGTASVYVGNTPHQYDWLAGAHFLSNGLWQFDSELKSGKKKIPRTFYVNITPKVKPDQSGYPFQLNRQGLTELAAKDFKVVADYIGMLYQRDALGEGAKTLSNVQYLAADGSRRDVPNLAPPAAEAGLGAGIKAKAKVQVKDGQLVVNGKPVPVLDADTMSSSQIDVENYKVPPGTIDKDQLLFHDNMLIPEGLDVSLDKDSQKDKPKVLFSEWARAKYGDRFDRVNYQIADVFRRLRDLVVEVYDGDPEVAAWIDSAKDASFGVGFDKNYYGVNGVLPFRQMLVNPASFFRIDADKSAAGAFITMIHEIAHAKERNHGETFNHQFETILGDLAFDTDAALIRRNLRSIFQDNLDMLQDLHRTFIYAARNSLATPAGRSLQGNAEIKFRAVDGGVRRVAPPDDRAGQGGRSAGELSAGPGRGPGDPEGELDADGVRDEDSFSIDRTIDRPGWDDRTRAALNTPFTGPAKQTITQRFAGMRKDFLRRFTAAVADPFVGLKSLDSKLYMRARLTNGTDGGLEALLHFGQVYDNGGALDVKKGTKGLLDVLRPLGTEVEDFMRWVALNRAAQLKKQDRENYFTDEAIALRGKLIEGNMADGRKRSDVYREALAGLNSINKSVLDLARTQGLIDAAAHKRFTDDIWYVPFYRVAEENENEVSSYSSAAGLSGQEFSERLKGGTQRVDDLLTNVLRNWGGLLSASQKNAVARDALAQAETMGAAKSVRAGTKDAVTVMADGKPKSYLVEDPLVADALMSINTTALNNPIVKGLGWFKRALTGAVTIDPAFKLRNLIRDSIQSMALADLPFNPIANVARGMRASNDDNRISALAGGGLFHGHFFGEEDLAGKIERLVQQGVPRESIMRDPTQVTKAALDWYNRTGDRLENANRLALYDALIEKGKSHLEAAYAARDLMDFSLQGRSNAVRLMAATLPFFNARLQGLYKLGRDGVVPTMLTMMGKADEGQRKQAARFAAVSGAVVAASLLLYLLYKDDEDYQKRERWDRDGFWWFKVNGYAVRIPKPFEVGAIGTIAERALEQLIDRNAGGEEFAKSMLDMLVHTFAFDPIPQAFRPLINVAQNQDTFTDRPIESLGMQNLSKPERWGVGTTETAKALSQANAAAAGLLGPLGEGAVLSPTQIDYLVRGYFGWLGATLMQWSSGVANLASDIERPTMRIDQVPAVGGFIREVPSAHSRYVNEFYKSAEEVDRKWQDVKFYQRLGKFDEARALAMENKDVIALRGMYSQAQRAIATLNREMRRIEVAEGMDSAEKRTRLDELAARKSEIARRVESARREARAAA